eukprot:7566246-Alexandrium_andersonii.AAC.1
MPTSAETRSSKLSRGPICAVFWAREQGNENLPGAPQGLFCLVVRAGRRGGIDNAGNGGRARRAARKLTP